MRYTLYRTFEELGSPHRAVGTFTLGELQEMAKRGELHAENWIEERGFMGGRHRADRYGPLMELVNTVAGADAEDRPSEAAKLDLLGIIRASSRYRGFRDLIAMTATTLLTLTLLGSVVMLCIALKADSVASLLASVVSGAVACMLILVFKHALIVLVDLSDTLLRRQQADEAMRRDCLMGGED